MDYCKSIIFSVDIWRIFNFHVFGVELILLLIQMYLFKPLWKHIEQFT